MIDDIHTYIDNKGDIRINEALCSLALMQLKKELVIFHSNYAFWATVYITDDFYDEHVDLLMETLAKCLIGSRPIHLKWNDNVKTECCAQTDVGLLPFELQLSGVELVKIQIIKVRIMLLYDSIAR